MAGRRFAGRGAFALLLLLWLGCFALSWRSYLVGHGMSTLLVAGASGPDAYPVIDGFRSWLDVSVSGLRPGDQLVRVGESDLRGAGRVAVFLRIAEQSKGLAVPVEVRRGEDPGYTTLALGWFYRPPPLLLAAALFALVGFGVWARARASPLIAVALPAVLAHAFWLSARFAGPPGLTLASGLVETLSQSLVLPLWLRAAYALPDGRLPRRRLARVAPWVLAPLGLLGMLSVYDVLVPQAIAFLGSIALGLVFCIAALVGVARAWRRSDAAQRRRIKWIILGVWITVLPAAVTALLTLVDPIFVEFFFLSMVFTAALPVTVLLAAWLDDLFDVDRLLSATASYNLLAIVVVGVGLVAVPRAAEAASAWLGVAPGAGSIAVSLALAGALVPAHRRLRPFIERLFFAERFAVDRGVDDLLAALADRAQPSELLTRWGEGCERLFRPETCAVYARAEAGWAAAHAAGGPVPTVVQPSADLLGSLATRRRPLTPAAARAPGALGAVDRAALQTLGAEVLVPARRGDALFAFLCLGSKLSGDVYTTADLALLAALGDRVSSELARFDQGELLRETHDLQARLQRYVPGAVADVLAGGGELGEAEREISVLFCDLRGYTGFSESRAPGEVFATINRYTEAVSALVRERGGTIVEFGGDGLMAIFGAPAELARKEAAAVEAGRAIVSAVDTLDASARLSVGVGIATGPAFVGNIRAVDRSIWTAIGNTVNLAARLQALTRELEVAILIDAATQQAAGGDVGDFTARPGVRVRGRSTPFDLFSLAEPG